MAKKLGETEAASSIAMKRLSENQKIIQEQAKVIQEKEKESSNEGLNVKDKEKELDHADMTQRLEEYDALLTKAMNELSEKKKIIQEQAKKIEENSRRVVVMQYFLKIRKLSDSRDFELHDALPIFYW